MEVTSWRGLTTYQGGALVEIGQKAEGIPASRLDDKTRYSLKNGGYVEYGFHKHEMKNGNTRDVIHLVLTAKGREWVNKVQQELPL